MGWRQLAHPSAGLLVLACLSVTGCQDLGDRHAPLALGIGLSVLFGLTVGGWAFRRRSRQLETWDLASDVHGGSPWSVVTQVVILDLGIITLLVLAAFGIPGLNSQSLAVIAYGVGGVVVGSGLGLSAGLLGANSRYVSQTGRNAR